MKGKIYIDQTYMGNNAYKRVVFEDDGISATNESLIQQMNKVLAHVGYKVTKKSSPHFIFWSSERKTYDDFRELKFNEDYYISLDRL